MAAQRSAAQRIPLIALGLVLIVVGVIATGVWSTDGKSAVSIVGGVVALCFGLGLLRVSWRR